MSDDTTRSIEMERELDGTPEEIWELLTTSEGLRRWFPLDARVGDGEGGEVWLSWGPGAEAGAPIHVWEVNRRFGWREPGMVGFPDDYHEGSAEPPVPVAVDFYIEGRGGKTVLRLVQSGLSADAKWDEMYDAMVDGWTYFLFNLAWYVLKHRGKPRRMAWKRAATDLTRDAIWDRLLGAALISVASGGGEVPSESRITIDANHPVEVVSMREGYHFAGALPDLDDSLFFVEVEGNHVGFWLSTYGVDEERVDALQNALDERIAAALGA